MRFTEEQVMKELKKIQADAPQMLVKHVVLREMATPTIKKIALEALKSETIPQEKKDEIQVLLDNGHFDKEIFREDPKIAEQLNNYMKRAINKAVKEGRLPTKKQMKELQPLWQEQRKTTSESSEK